MTNSKLPQNVDIPDFSRKRIITLTKDFSTLLLNSFNLIDSTLKTELIKLIKNEFSSKFLKLGYNIDYDEFFSSIFSFLESKKNIGFDINKFIEQVNKLFEFFDEEFEFLVSIDNLSSPNLLGNNILLTIDESISLKDYCSFVFDKISYLNKNNNLYFQICSYNNETLFFIPVHSIYGDKFSKNKVYSYIVLKSRKNVDNDKKTYLYYQTLFSILYYLSNDWIKEYVSYGLRKLVERGIKDDLTGLLRRNIFKDKFNDLCGYFPISAILLFDIDNFKNINDKYGHAVGDIVLKSLGESILECSLHGRLYSRHGGEEFSIFYADNSEEIVKSNIKDDVLCIYKKLNEKLEKYNIGKVTFSGGVAFNLELENSLEINNNESLYANLMKLADNNLYVAKGKGKRKIYMYNECLELN